MATKLEQVRIDQYLTNFIQKEVEGQAVGDFISPAFKVNRPSDKYLKYGKQNLRYIDNKVVGRAPAKEIDVSTDTGTYSCEKYATGFFVGDDAIRNVDGVAGIRLREQKAMNAARSQARSREKRIWDIAGSASIVTQTAGLANAWDSSSGTPVTNILTAIKTINDSTGIRANSIVMSLSAALKAIQTTEWKAYFQYTSEGFKGGLFDCISGLRQLGLEPMISGMRSLSTYEIGTSDPTAELISGVGKVLVFARETNPTTESNCFMFSPYTIKDEVKSWREEQQDGEAGKITEEIDELLVNASCAYLYTAAVA
jgi:hypothetical protein